MKTKFLLSLFLLSVLFISCKDDKSKVENESTPIEEVNNFKVILNIIVKKDDTFTLFYTKDGSTDFTKIAPIWLDVKGSNVSQDVVFNLPEDVIPSQLRLDFGINKEQDEIIINKFEMNYFGKSFKVPGEEFYIYFDADKSKTIFDKSSKTIKGLTIDGIRQSPSFYPNIKPLGDEITKLIQ